jgi:DNA-binding MarR family transcriptional regulator
MRTDQHAQQVQKLEDLGCALERIHALAAAQVLGHMASILHGGDMSFSQLNALFRLYRHGPQTIAELARNADLSPTAASRMVERLVQAGLVMRQECIQDRRQKKIELTEVGMQKLDSLRRLTAQSYATLLAPVPEETLRRFADAVGDVISSLPSHFPQDLPQAEAANVCSGVSTER